MKKKNTNAFNKAVEDVRDRLHFNPAGDWDGADTTTALGLYAHLHEVVYGIEADDLAEEWYPALSKAKAFLRDKFGGDFVKFAEYMRWVWRKERKEIENFKKKNPGDTRDFRITWRYNFSTKLVVKHRMATVKI